MTNILGLIMAIGGIAYLSLLHLQIHKKHISELDKACEILSDIKGELSIRPYALTDLFSTLKNLSFRQNNSFYIDIDKEMSNIGSLEFCQIWSNSAEKNFSAFSEDELYEFCRLGVVLNRADFDVQLRSIEKCENKLSSNAVQKKSDYPQIRKLTVGLAASAAVCLIILFV